MTAVQAGRAPAGETWRGTVERLQSAQKSGKGAPAYSRFVNRRLGRWLAAAAYHRGLTPNGVSGISAAFSFAGIAVLALTRPSWGTAVLVTGALVLGYALDAADGQLARLRGGGTPSGEWLDHMVDAAKISSLHLSVLVATYHQDDLDRRWLLVPLAYTVVANVSFFAQLLNEQLRRGVTLRTGAEVPAGAPSTLRSLLVLPTDYGVLCLIFLLLGAPVAFLSAYALLAAGSAGYLLLAVRKWFHDMRALDALVVPAAASR